MSKPIYIFLDEAGNLDFSNNGTEYFILTSLAIERPFQGYLELVELRYDLIEYGYNIEMFHASEDKQAIRNRVFNVVCDKLDDYRLDSLIVKKRKIDPVLQTIKRFYPEMVGTLLKHVLKEIDLSKYSEVIVITDTIPLKKKRRVIEGETKRLLKQYVPKNKKFRVMHHSSRSNICLQIIDYCCWAIFRKWERDDERSYKLIKKGVANEFEVFRRENRKYY